MNDPVHIDHDALSALREIMEDEFPVLIETFLEDLEAKLKDLEEGIDQADLQRFSELSHSLKGSASNLGLPQLRELSAQAEQAGKAGEGALCEELFARMQAEAAVVKGVLRAV